MGSLVFVLQKIVQTLVLLPFLLSLFSFAGENDCGRRLPLIQAAGSTFRAIEQLSKIRKLAAISLAYTHRGPGSTVQMQSENLRLIDRKIFIASWQIAQIKAAFQIAVRESPACWGSVQPSDIAQTYL